MIEVAEHRLFRNPQIAFRGTTVGSMLFLAPEVTLPAVATLIPAFCVVGSTAGWQWFRFGPLSEGGICTVLEPAVSVLTARVYSTVDCKTGHTEC